MHLSLSMMRKIVDGDPATTPISVIKRQLSTSAQSQHNDIIATCHQLLTRPGIGRRCCENERIGAVRILLSLLPVSLPVVAELVQQRSTGRDAGEVRFTLFCHLDCAKEISGQRMEKKLRSLVRHFLMTVASDTGRAAWMAGHILGSHWETVEAALDLRDVLQSGTYAAGRMAAVEALGEALHEKKLPEVEGDIRRWLESSQQHDRSQKVRSAARFELDRADDC